MEPIYRVGELTGALKTVQLPPVLASRAGLAPELTIALGAAQVEARWEAGGPDSPTSVALSGDLLERLRLPGGLECRVRTGNRTLRFGPAVAVLAGRTPDDLTPARLSAMANHFLTERERGGLFYACDWQSIDPEGGEVRGFRLVPGARDKWEEGLFPLPQVLCRRYGLSLGAKFAGLREHGVRVLNERVFQKWEAWQWLAEDRFVRPHLPDTASLHSPADALTMLERHGTVFLKPVWGSLGSRIQRVRRQEGGGFQVDGSGRRSHTYAGVAALAADLADTLPRPGLVQQGLDLAAVGGRLVDFRVVVQKDGFGRWSTTGIVGRCGTAGLFLSNMATGGFPLPAEAALALLFGEDPTTLFRRRQELAELGRAVGRALDRSGLMLCDLGVDVAFDRDDHPWVIEVNNRDPDHNIGWEAGLWPLFYQFRTRPVEHACWLAGFGPYEGGQ